MSSIADMYAVDWQQFFSKTGRRFFVRESTPEEAECFKGRRGPGEIAVTIIASDGDCIWVPARGSFENTDEEAERLLREMRCRVEPTIDTLDPEIPF